MKKVWVLFLALLLISLRPGMAGAAAPVGEEINPSSLHCGVCEAAESQNFGKSAPGKIGRGLVNIGLGWTNLFAQPVHAGKSGGNVLSGIGKGLGYTVIRTVQGVVELGLFWLPAGPGGEVLNHCALGDMGITQR